MKPKHLLLCLAVLFWRTVLAQSVGTEFTVDNLKFKVTSSTSVSVSGVVGTLSGHVNIPETVSNSSNTYTVQSIAYNAFSSSTYCKNIKAITLPSTVTIIGSNAFSQCSLSDSLVVKGVITSIGNNAFKSGICINRLDIYNQEAWWNASFGTTMSNPICFCSHLYCKGKPVKSLYINMANIPANAFSYCSFNTVIIGPTVKTIGTGCFGTIYKTIWLPNVVPSGSPKDAEGIINYCSSVAYTENSSLTTSSYHVYPSLSSRFEVGGVYYALLSNNTECDVIDCNYSSDPVSVDIGSTVTYQGRTYSVRNINAYACYDDDCITGGITIANTGNVGDSAFYQCNKAVGVFCVTNTGNIGSYAFYDCGKATGIVANNGGTIGAFAFSKCLSATSGEITNQGNIESNAFANCSGFKTLTVSNQGYIGVSAFSNCTGLNALTISNDGDIKRDAFKSSKITQTVTISNNGHIREQAFSQVTGGFSADINNRGSLADSAFFSSKMSTLTIGSNVTTIGFRCFDSSTIATKLIIENTGEIGTYAFASTLGGYIAQIKSTGILPNFCFDNSNMGNVTIDGSVSTLGAGCFRNCEMGDVEIYGSVSIVCSSCFQNCKMGDVTIGNTVTTLESWCFQNSTMGTVTIGNSVTIIDYKCFDSSTMRTVTIGNSVGVLGESSFASSYFTDISIGPKVHTIKRRAFSGAKGFTQIFLPDNVVTLEPYSFENCSSMKNITLSRGLSDLQEGTFSGCIVLESLTVPKEINTIEDFVFNNCSELKTLVFEDKSGNYILGIGGTTSDQTGLFKTCGLDSVYVGGALKYSTSSPTYSPFYQQTTLRSIKFTDKESKLYAKEFQGCTKLENIWMGPTIDDVGEYAFSGCKSLKTITIGPAVTTLGQYSFNECLALRQIDLANVVTIKNNTFQQCRALPQVDIPQSTTSIENQVFIGCSALKRVIIKDRTEALALGINSPNVDYKGITGAGKPIFSDCPLDSVYIGGPISYSKTLSSGYSPFFYNEKLRSVFITNKEKQVYTNEFYNCLGLQRIKLGDGVTKINDLGFQSCTGLLYFEFAPTLQSIGADAFSDCNNIKTIISHAATPPVVGEQGLEDINFWECTLYVPDGSESAYQEAEQWKNFFVIPMLAVTSVELNATEMSIEGPGETFTLEATVYPSNAFDKSLTWTSSNPDVATVSNSGVVTTVDYGTAIITVTTNDGSDKSAACEVKIDASNIVLFADDAVRAICLQSWDSNGNGKLSKAEAAAVTDIGTVFQNNTQIMSFDELSYFTGLTSIASQAFNGCTGLTSITIPENITSIGSDAFKDCTGLTKAEFASIEDLCSMVFENYEANPLYNAHHLYINGDEITELVIPNSVTSIGNYAFMGCSSLTSATIPNSVTEIGINTFNRCTALASVSLPDNLTKISDGMFTNCSNLASIIIPEQVTYIGKCAFQQSGITSIVIPNSVTTLAERDVFTSCSSLTSVYIGSGLKDLKNGHFYGCENLTKAEFASIEDLCGIEFSEGRLPYSNPLYYAHHLYINGEEVTDLVIPNSVTKIGYYTFIGCSSITSVTIPESVTEIKNQAFSGCSGITTVKIYKETPLSNCPFQNRANAILYVPAGCKATYQAADLWNEFSEIIEMEGNVAAGDANGDGDVNVTDYLAIANYILGSNTANFDVAAADVNGDKDINVSDYVGVANIILYGNWQGPSVNGSRAMGAEETSPWMEIGLSEDGKMNLLLRDTKPFSAFQMDIRLPEGVEIADVNMAKANQTKNLGFSRLQDGTWRLLYGTLDNKTVNLGGDHLLTLELASSNSSIGGFVTIDNIFLADRNASTVRLNAVQSGLPTGIYSIESGVSINGDCYDLTGRKVDNSQLKKGVYIVNGKKTFVK